MAWLLGISRRAYRELEAGRLRISNDLYERIAVVWGGLNLLGPDNLPSSEQGQDHEEEANRSHHQKRDGIHSSDNLRCLCESKELEG